MKIEIVLFSMHVMATKSWDASIQAIVKASVEVQCKLTEKLQKLLIKFMEAIFAYLTIFSRLSILINTIS